MLKIIKDHRLMSVYEVENIYRNCNILMTNPIKKEGVTHGEVYAISDSIDTHNALLDLEASLMNEGIKTILVGEYKGSLSVDHLRMVKIA